MLMPKGGERMQRVVPEYYAEFQCIGGACRHSCCIGWEIDIDPDTAAFYRTVSGALGRRLREHVTQDGVPHFCLDERERCPFLNECNLCDIILELGEDRLCDICADHPRFRNELPGRVESGLGLCCEEAARLILGRSEPTALLGSTDTDDAILLLRERVFAALQNRAHSIPQRVETMLALCGSAAPSGQPDAWATLLLTLERLDEAWTARLTTLRDGFAAADTVGFDRHMADRQTEYEQLLTYLIYRHFANAADQDDAAARARFAAFGYRLLYAFGAVQWTQSSTFTFEDQVELARAFSSEIEYSDENLDILLDTL